MKLLEKLKEWSTKEIDFHTEKVLTHHLGSELPKIAQYKSEKDLQKSHVFMALQEAIQNVTFGYEYGCYSDEREGFLRPNYRAVLWNLENGINYTGILETLRNRAFVTRADIYFFPEVDIGMYRSGNRDVVRDLAIELGYNYFFAASYLHVDGSPTEDPTQPYNRLGLSGNAIMTRLPISNLRVIPLHEPHDLLAGKDRRLGSQKALLVDLLLSENKKLTLVCINLPENTSAWFRAKTLKTILKKIQKENPQTPILIAGDFKTTTYDCQGTWPFFFSVLNKAYRGYDYIAQEHHTYPEKFFEKQLFDEFHDHGFDVTAFNETGVGTYHAYLNQLMARLNNGHGPTRLLQKVLKKHEEKFSFKDDWFAGNHCIRASQRHQAERPKVISHLIHDGKSVSSHDPVLLDFELVYEMTG